MDFFFPTPSRDAAKSAATTRLALLPVTSGPMHWYADCSPGCKMGALEIKGGCLRYELTGGRNRNDCVNLRIIELDQTLFARTRRARRPSPLVRHRQNGSRSLAPLLFFLAHPHQLSHYSLALFSSRSAHRIPEGNVMVSVSPASLSLPVPPSLPPACISSVRMSSDCQCSAHSRPLLLHL